MTRIHLLRQKGHVLFFCLMMAFLLSSCGFVKEKLCKQIIDPSGKIHWVCPKTPVTSGYKCMDAFEGRTGCNNCPTCRCTTVVDQTGFSDCKCQ